MIRRAVDRSSELLERNNFGSTRLGLMARKPFGSFVGEMAITRAFTWGTDSTEKLALTLSPLVLERLIDKLALQLGMDRVEIRRKNFIQPDAFPYASAAGFTYDTGEYEKALDKALEVCEVLSGHPRGMTLSDLARGVHLPASTVHRLLGVLKRRGIDLRVASPAERIEPGKPYVARFRFVAFDGRPEPALTA